jgi:1-acyl-sn-glycerol-3-phosphate acyltransferase
MFSKMYPKRFPAYITTQSLGAFNDNFFKMLLQLYVLQVLVERQAAKIMSEESFIFLATLVFTIPFVLFGTWSGYLADKYAKSKVMRLVKVAEIGIMLLGVFSLYLENVYLMFAVLFLMASQSTFFSPAKYGYIPETAHPRAVTAANSWVEMTTFISIILGSAVTGLLLTYHNFNAVMVAYYCVGVAALGTLSAMFIGRVPAVGTGYRFPVNPLAGMISDLVFLKKQKKLFVAALANSYFWLIGLIFQTNILIYGKNMLANHPNGTILLSLLPAYIGVGIAVGSMLASRWSGKKVELGLVMLGGLGMSFAGIALYFTTHLYEAASVILFIAGMFGGLYIVPLYAYLQFFSRKDEKGRVMATTGILNGLFMVLGALIYGLFAVNLAIPPQTIYLLMGIITILVLGYVGAVIPEYLTRFFFWLLTHTAYRVKISGGENMPFHGPVLFLPNHVSAVDAFLIASTSQRFIHFILPGDSSNSPVFKKLWRLMNAMIVETAGQDTIALLLKQSKKLLEKEHAVCIFPEREAAQNGKTGLFLNDLQEVLGDINCPIIPVYIHNAENGFWDFDNQKGAARRRKRWFHPVTIAYGKQLPENAKIAEAEKAIKSLKEEITRQTGRGGLL